MQIYIYIYILKGFAPAASPPCGKLQSRNCYLELNFEVWGNPVGGLMEVILAPSWRSWGSFWLRVGLSWLQVGGSGDILGPSWGVWGHLGSKLGGLEGHLGSKLEGLEAILAPSWEPWGHVEAKLAQVWANLEPDRPKLDPSWPQNKVQDDIESNFQ